MNKDRDNSDSLVTSSITSSVFSKHVVEARKNSQPKMTLGLRKVKQKNRIVFDQTNQRFVMVSSRSQDSSVNES